MSAPFLFLEVTLVAGGTQLVNIDAVQLINPIATGVPGDPDRAQFVMVDGTLIDATNTYDGVKTQLGPVVP